VPRHITPTMRFYEDFERGDVEERGSYEVTRDEMVGFAEWYDPQPFHVDEEAARESHFGGLVASGWYTCAVTMRLVVEGVLDDHASMGAAGVEEIEWREPVRPGDVLSVRLEVVDKEVWDDEKGLIRYEQDTVRESDGAVVASMVPSVLFARRDG